MSKIQQIGEEAFQQEVIKSESPVVLVDFSATWCGPCKAQLPILEQLASDHEDVKVVKIDVDDSPSLAAKYGIRSIPALIVFAKGEKITTKVGLTKLDDLVTLVSSAKKK